MWLCRGSVSIVVFKWLNRCWGLSGYYEGLANGGSCYEECRWTGRLVTGVRNSQKWHEIGASAI